MGIDQTRQRHQLRGVDDLGTVGHVESDADGGDPAVNALDVDVAELTVGLVEGCEMGDVAKHQVRHRPIIGRLCCRRVNSAAFT